MNHWILRYAVRPIVRQYHAMFCIYIVCWSFLDSYLRVRSSYLGTFTTWALNNAFHIDAPQNLNPWWNAGDLFMLASHVVSFHGARADPISKNHLRSRVSGLVKGRSCWPWKAGNTNSHREIIESQDLNGHFSNLNWRYLPYIRSI